MTNSIDNPLPRRDARQNPRGTNLERSLNSASKLESGHKGFRPGFKNSARPNAPEEAQASDFGLWTSDFGLRTSFGLRLSGLGVRRRRAFTLIELLVVIAIISLLAAMIFPITKAVNRTKIRTRARAELAQVETAIESYKAKYGIYPPDNPKSAGDPMFYASNPLYYELVGTTNDLPAAKDRHPVGYRTLDGTASIWKADALYLLGVDGFINCNHPGSGDEGPQARNFFPGLAQINIGIYTNSRPSHPSDLIILTLVCSIPWPNGSTGPRTAGNALVNIR